MSIDAELQRHRETWNAFTQLLKWGTIGIVLILALMALFLL